MFRKLTWYHRHPIRFVHTFLRPHTFVAAPWHRSLYSHSGRQSLYTCSILAPSARFVVSSAADHIRLPTLQTIQRRRN
jgi:hypothetical protein